MRRLVILVALLGGAAPALAQEGDYAALTLRVTRHAVLPGERFRIAGRVAGARRVDVAVKRDGVLVRSRSARVRRSGRFVLRLRVDRPGRLEISASTSGAAATARLTVRPAGHARRGCRSR